MEGAFSDLHGTQLADTIQLDGRLVMMTPIDPAFLLIRLLEAGHVCQRTGTWTQRLTSVPDRRLSNG